MKIFLALCFLFFSHLSWSKNTIIDPHGILNQVDTFVDGVPFNQAFKAGQLSKYKNKCLVDGCTIENEFTTMEVAYVDEHSVMIYISKANRKEFPLNEEIYEGFNRNPLRVFLNKDGNAQIGTDATIHINEIVFTRGTVLGEAYPQAIVKTLQVTVDENGNEFEFPIDYTITKGLSAIAQVSHVQMPTYYEAKLIELNE